MIRLIIIRYDLCLSWEMITSLDYGMMTRNRKITTTICCYFYGFLLLQLMSILVFDHVSGILIPQPVCI